MGQVVVLAATNRLDDLDEAVIRRFEAKVYVGLPSLTVRVHMLRTHMQHVPCALSEEEFHRVAQLTAEWSGSDIEVLCREAGKILLMVYIVERFFLCLLQVFTFCFFYAAMGPVRDFAPYQAILQERCSSLLYDSTAGTQAAWATNDVGSSILAAATSTSITTASTAAATVSDEEPFTNKSRTARAYSPPPSGGTLSGSGPGSAKQRLVMVSPAHTPIGKIHYFICQLCW